MAQFGTQRCITPQVWYDQLRGGDEHLTQISKNSHTSWSKVQDRYDAQFKLHVQNRQGYLKERFIETKNTQAAGGGDGKGGFSKIKTPFNCMIGRVNYSPIHKNSDICTSVTPLRKRPDKTVKLDKIARTIDAQPAVPVKRNQTPNIVSSERNRLQYLFKGNDN